MQHYSIDRLETIKKEILLGWEPQVLIVAIKLPTGAVEIIQNNTRILDKVCYYLSAYDSEARLKTCQEIRILDVMGV